LKVMNFHHFMSTLRDNTFLTRISVFPIPIRPVNQTASLGKALSGGFPAAPKESVSGSVALIS
jgi:hypothetical protein